MSLEFQKFWLDCLPTLDLPEQELLKLLAEDTAAPQESEELAPATASYLRRELTLLKHDFLRWWHYRSPLLRLTYLGIWLTFLITAVVKSNLGLWGTLAGLAGILFIKSKFVLRDLHPSHMKMLERGYDERKLAFEKLIHTQQQWLVVPPTAREIARFQQEALALIALYMRDHRIDLKTKKIFANLLVRDGEEMVVIARSDPVRPVPQRYSKDECTYCWEAIDERRATFTGNLYRDRPATQPGKRYNSIVVLPVRLEGQVLGVVSIDSESTYHFDRYFEDLQTHLAPYVQLLAVTLSDTYVCRIQSLESGEPDGRHSSDP